LEARGITAIVATTLVATVGATRAHAAAPERVAVLAVPAFQPAAYAARGAVGLYIPGAGDTATREGALASIVRGKIEKSVLGGVPSGRPKIALATRPAAITIYVALPPPGKHPNTTRYPIAIVGAGYHGILTSPSTRIRGLVSMADIAPTVLALERGARPTIRSRPDTDAPADLRRLDRRLTRSHSVRLAATIVLVCAVFGGALLARVTGAELLARAGLLAAPSTLAASLLLSGLDVTRPRTVVVLMALLTVGASLGFATSERALLVGLVSVIAAYLVVLAEWPLVNALAAIGPHPDGGGRFYGSTNLTSAVLLPVALVASVLAGRRGWAVAALALLTVGWSRAGADGGGLVMLVAAFAVLVLRLRKERPAPRSLALGTAAVVAAALVLVGLDAATGGSSHVTHAVGKGPGALLGDLASRLHISWATLTSQRLPGLVFLAAVGALAVLASRPPHTALCEALIAGVGVSLLVNDTPNDVAAAGALSYAVLWAWERVRAAPVHTTRLDSTADAPPGSRSDRRRLRAAARRLRRGEDSVAGAADR
jgi:hypothetical protein